ncbi:MAG TPA: hypothetical protein VLB68_27360 [Pyrinomonadaceae bacterium]|nr:hypothetical protein [Pyrinomonadaceae bacterium]
MGTDSIKLFNKTLADEILAMDQPSLTRFLEENLDSFKRKKFSSNSLLLQMGQNGDLVSDAVENLLTGAYSLPALKNEVVRDLAFGEEEIYLDYWGCYAFLFDDHPSGSISSLDYVPNEEEETFLLLQTANVNQIIESLYAHIDDLNVMDREKVKRVEDWRNHCVCDRETC